MEKHLGGTAKDIKVLSPGLGLMRLTWQPVHTPDEQAFAMLNEAIARGCTFWNSSEFYGNADDPRANLKMLARYFTAYPEAASKVFLSVKGGVDSKTLKPTLDRASMIASVENSVAALAGTKHIDLFQGARTNFGGVPIEETIGALKEMRDAGKISHIGMSECSADSIRRANAIAPISAVEVEYSLFSRDIERNGVLDTCSELAIPIIAYSPLSRGLLTGVVTSSTLQENDVRLRFDRFQPENEKHNAQLVQFVRDLAAQKNCTPAQFALAWVNSCARATVIPIPGSTTVERFLENQESVHVEITKEDRDKIDRFTASFEVKGGRYYSMAAPTLWG